MLDPETKSLWSHILGRCFEGPLKGAQLKSLPSDMVTWKEWRKRHPQTTVLNMSRKHGDYTKEFYAKRGADQFVLGVMVRGVPFHLPWRTLQQQPVLNFTANKQPLVCLYDASSTSAQLYGRTVGDRALAFQRDGDKITDAETGSTWNNRGQAVAGELKGKQLSPVVGIPSFTRAWLKFHAKSSAVAGQDRN
jgi:hypothetical protein